MRLGEKQDKILDMLRAHGVPPHVHCFIGQTFCIMVAGSQYTLRIPNGKQSMDVFLMDLEQLLRRRAA